MTTWLQEAGAHHIPLRPFHNYGESKYTLLDMSYTLRGVNNLHPQELEDYRKIYLCEGTETFF